MIVTAELRLEEAHRTLESAGQRVHELYAEELAATARRDYAAATTAARARMLNQEVYNQARAVVLRGGHKR